MVKAFSWRGLVVHDASSHDKAMDILKRVTIQLCAVSYLAKPADIDEILATFQDGEETKADLDDQPLEPPSLARVEWEHIQRVLTDCDNNISAAARKLWIHRRTLLRKLFIARST